MHKLAENEVVFHNQLYHPNVIQLLGHSIDREKQTTYMVLEYADGGTLFDKIKSEVLSKSQVRNYFRDVCEAVDYLHSNEIMHRDIKVPRPLRSPKTSCSPKVAVPNCATSGSPPSWARGRLCAAPTSTCRPK